jgi:hypothetical protein
MVEAEHWRNVMHDEWFVPRAARELARPKQSKPRKLIILILTVLSLLTGTGLLYYAARH